MTIGTSLLLIAVGAIMRFAVTATATGFSIHTAGVILIVLGAVGLLIGLVFAGSWAERRRGGQPL